MKITKVLVVVCAIAILVAGQRAPVIAIAGPLEPEEPVSPVTPKVRPEDTEQLNLIHSLSMFADIVLHQGDNLQTALNNAAPGDTITLDAGAEFVGSFSLPTKSGATYITIRSSQLSSLIAGVRVSPSSVSNMARIRTNVGNGPALFTSGASHHWRIQGIEIATTTGVSSDGGVVRIGSNPTETSLSQITHDFDFDRDYLHGQPTQNVQQGFILNAQDATVQNSYISDVHYVGADSQAILTWTSPGGLHIINNYLEAAGENFLSGGADTGIANLVPGMTGGIEIRRNYFFKPLSWKVGDPSYAGIHWSIKNLLELKNAKNVTVDGNVFENSWGDAQIGYAILFTVRNQNGTNPWAVLTNISFTNNTVKNSEQGFQLLGSDNLNPSQQCSGLTIQNNLVIGVTNRGFTSTTTYTSVTIAHNTYFQGGNIMSLSGTTSSGFVHRDNITIRNPAGFGVFGDNVGEGTVALTTYMPGFSFIKNVLVATNSAIYPANNFYPADVATVQFVDYNGGNYALKSTSPYHNAASDGTDIGVDMTALLAAQNGSSPTPTPAPTATPTLTISGTNTLNNSGLSGVTVRLLRASDRALLSSTTSGSNGTYQLNATSGTSVIVSPALTGYTFSPSEVLYSTIAANQTANFIATGIATPTPTPTPLPSPTPTPSVSPTPQPSPRACGPNELISSGCTCLTKVIGPPHARRCRP